MALATNTEFTITSTATTGNVNGSGFNPLNSNMLTDLTTDTNTANTASPVVSSASYNFVAGDVGNWVYIQSGTNWTSGWYQIASVASNKATLSAAIGSAQVHSLGFKTASTVLGCATVGTPTAGTFTIDYSQTDTAVISARADFAAVGSSTNLTSATGGFTPVMVGNYFHQTTTGTGAFGVVGWYEIVSYTNATTLVLDRTPNNGTASVACTGYIGGAGRFNGLEDAFFEMSPAGAKVWTKAGTYTISTAVSVASTNGTFTNPIWYLAFTTMPGDFTPGSFPVVLNNGANNGFVPNVFTNFVGWHFTGTATSVMQGNQTSVRFFYCKCSNTSTAAGRSAWNTISYLYFCEGVSQNGYAYTHTGSSALIRVHGCYFHDSAIGANINSSSMKFSKNVISNCGLALRNAVSAASATCVYENNTLIGRPASPTGVGFDFTISGAGNQYLMNNIITGFATGIQCAASNDSVGGMNNCFYNNTADVSNYRKDKTDFALDPQFTDVAETAITNGTMTGGTATLTSSGANFASVEDGVDYFVLISHSGGTGTFIGTYLITGHTSTTLTFNNNAGTSGSATSIVGYVMTGHDYSIGTNMKGSCNAVMPTYTSYIDCGAVQRQESGGGTVGWAAAF